MGPPKYLGTKFNEKVIISGRGRDGVGLTFGTDRRNGTGKGETGVKDDEGDTKESRSVSPAKLRGPCVWCPCRDADPKM